MTHIITSLCLRDGACVEVCPVECIIAGKPEERMALVLSLTPIRALIVGRASPNARLKPSSLRKKFPMPTK